MLTVQQLKTLGTN